LPIADRVFQIKSVYHAGSFSITRVPSWGWRRLDLETLDLVLEGADLAHEVGRFVRGDAWKFVSECPCYCVNEHSLQAMTERATPQARPKAILEGT
jgi:hypothetical protein